MRARTRVVVLSPVADRTRMRDADAVSETRRSGRPPVPMIPRAALPASKAAPLAPSKPVTPRAPVVVQKNDELEPPSSEWEVVEGVTESSVPTPRYLPAVELPGGPPRLPYQTSLGVGGPVVESPAPQAPAAPASASGGTLDGAVREEIARAVRAAMDDAMAPLAARALAMQARVESAEQALEASASRARLLEARLENAERIAAAAKVETAVSRLAPVPSIPVTMAPSAASAPPPPAPAQARSVAGRSPALAAPSGHQGGVAPSMQPQRDYESAAIDISAFDGGRRKRIVAWIVVLVLVLIMSAAVTSAVLSY